MGCTGKTVPFYFIISTGFPKTLVPVNVKMSSVPDVPLNFFF